MGFNVSVRVKKIKQQKTEELTSKTDRAKPRKTWTKDKTREGTIQSRAARPETRADRNGCSP